MPKHQHRTLTRKPGRKTSFPFQVFIMDIVYLDKNKEKEKLQHTNTINIEELLLLKSYKKSASALLTSDKSWRVGIWKADLCFPLTNRRNLERVGACARHVKRHIFIISYF